MNLFRTLKCCPNENYGTLTKDQTSTLSTNFAEPGNFDIIFRVESDLITVDDFIGSILAF